MSPLVKRLAAPVVSIAFLVLIYLLVDVGAVLDALGETDVPTLLLSLVLLVVLVGVSALRLRMVGAAAGVPISVRTAFRATFAANALNTFLPGKMGDVLKASLIADAGHAPLPTAVGLGVWEKGMDLALLFAIAVVPMAASGRPLGALAFALVAATGFAVLFAPELAAARVKPGGKVGRVLGGWVGLVAAFRARPGRVALVLVVSAAIWAGHLVQICLLAAALGVHGDAGFWLAFASLMPIAIAAGLVPLTFAGVGSRDAALVVVVGPLIGAGTAAALGVLFWLRYLVPGILGAPLLPAFFRSAATQVREVRRGAAGKG